MFIAKDPGRRTATLYTGEELTARFPRKSRATGRRIGGLFVEMEDAGIDRSRLTLTLTGNVAEHNGRRVSDRGHRLTPVRSTAAEVGKVVRVIRPEDEGLLAAKDMEIAAVLEQLQALRVERKALAVEVWGRAERMPTVGDLMEQASS